MDVETNHGGKRNYRDRKPSNFDDLTHVDLTRPWTGHAWLRSTSILESPFPVARVSKRQIDG